MRTERRFAAPLRSLVAAALLGAVFSLGFVHTQVWWLALACIGLLAWLIADAKPAQAAALGAAFGTTWLAAGTWWLFISMHRYGGLPAPLAALAVLALAAALSLYLAGALALFARLRRGHIAADALLFGALWLLAELARGLLLTGFPWVASGYSQVDSPLAALAPWVGVYGLGALLATGAAAIGLGARAGRQWGAAAAVAAGLLAAPLAQRDFTTSSGRVGVTLIQTNVAQDQKFAADHLPGALAWLDRALRAAPGPLVIAPETAIPLLPEQLGDLAWQQMTESFREGPRAALIGLPLGSFEAGYTNSAAGVAARIAAPGFYRYDKHHLVPFGEFIPPGFRWFTDMMAIPLGDFSRGPLVAPSFEALGQRIAPTICYEDLFGEEIARRFGDAGDAPTVLANLSNIGWFGNTIAIGQHLNISRLRTLELQRPMLRATNTGATAAIDHRGRVSARLPAFTRGSLQAEVEGRRGLTPYARWVAAAGLWPLVALGTAVVALAAWSRRARAKAAS